MCDMCDIIEKREIVIN